MRIRDKKIAVLMDGSAFARGKAAEAMRMAVGLTLRNPGVQLILMDGGAKILDTLELYPEAHPPLAEHLNAYLDLGCPLVLEEKSGGRPRHLLEGSGMEAKSRREIIREITDSHLVILLGDAAPVQEAPKETQEPFAGGDDSVGILHIVRKAPGGLFYQVVRSQRNARRLTIVLLPGAQIGDVDLPGQILELGSRKKGGKNTGLVPRISYPELVDLIFEHQRIFCW